MTREHLLVLYGMKNSELAKKCTNTMMIYIRRMSTSVQCVRRITTTKYKWPTIQTQPTSEMKINATPAAYYLLHVTFHKIFKS